MTRLSEALKLLAGPERIQIRRGKEVLYTGWRGCIQYDAEERAFLKDDPEVERIALNLEITARDYKERGLIPPNEPEIARQYSFKDLELYLYFVIEIK